MLSEQHICHRKGSTPQVVHRAQCSDIPHWRSIFLTRERPVKSFPNHCAGTPDSKKARPLECGSRASYILDELTLPAVQKFKIHWKYFINTAEHLVNSLKWVQPCSRWHTRLETPKKALIDRQKNWEHALPLLWKRGSIAGVVHPLKPVGSDLPKWKMVIFRFLWLENPNRNCETEISF